jgi:hypothetical protein
MTNEEFIKNAEEEITRSKEKDSYHNKN